ncbi:CP2J2 protein, partial [Polypterus senegalus]
MSGGSWQSWREDRRRPEERHKDCEPWTLGESVQEALGGARLSNGYTWKEHKRFVLTTLRNFGVGKKSLESIIMEEVKFFVEAFEEERGQPFNPHYMINNAVSNIICLIVLGHRFEYSDSHYQEIQHLMNKGAYLEGSWWTWAYNAFPGLMRYLPGGHNELFSSYGKVMDFLREEIRNHKKDLDPTSPRDFIDAYLKEMEKRKNDPAAEFNDDTLCSNTFDLFVAGGETTATTLRWALLFMAQNPHIQEKVQAEIDSVLGQTRLPSMEDKINLPYTEAVVHEVQRKADIVPVNLLKMTTEDMTIGGYLIPKDTAILINLSSVLNDKDEWETPDTFNPGHFLTPDGKFRRREAFMPFSAEWRNWLFDPEKPARAQAIEFWGKIGRWLRPEGPQAQRVVEQVAREGLVNTTPGSLAQQVRRHPYKDMPGLLDVLERQLAVLRVGGSERSVRGNRQGRAATPEPSRRAAEAPSRPKEKPIPPRCYKCHLLSTCPLNITAEPMDCTWTTGESSLEALLGQQEAPKSRAAPVESNKMTQGDYRFQHALRVSVWGSKTKDAAI